MGPKARKEIKEKNKLLVDEEPEADVLHVNLDPAEFRAYLAESRAAEEMELMEEAKKKSKAASRQVGFYEENKD